MSKTRENARRIVLTPAAVSPPQAGGSAQIATGFRAIARVPVKHRLAKKWCRGMPTPLVLDACCGPRSFWFDKKDKRALFVDRRRGIAPGVWGGVTYKVGGWIVDPDVVADFTKLPFEDSVFHLVVMDPPHEVRENATGCIGCKYESLRGKWREMIQSGFSECFRVLKSGGVLVFKWNEISVPLSEILKLTPEKPLFGHRSGKSSKTHWVCFLKNPAATARQ